MHMLVALCRRKTNYDGKAGCYMSYVRLISRNYFPKNQAPVQPERPSPVSTNQNQTPGNQAFVGVVPSPTPSQVLGGAPPSVSMNPSLLDQQFSNVLRMPTSGLAQSEFVLCCFIHIGTTVVPIGRTVYNYLHNLDMMNITNAYGNQGMSTLPSQNPTNLQRSPAVMNGSPMPPGAVNQFAQMTSMGKNYKPNLMGFC